MKYKLQITPEGNQYVGYALDEKGEIIFKTNSYRFATAASKELTKMIKESRPELMDNETRQHNIIDSTVNNNPSTALTQPANPSISPRKCCGRG
jgi:hypothetical protein